MGVYSIEVQLTLKGLMRVPVGSLTTRDLQQNERKGGICPDFRHVVRTPSTKGAGRNPDESFAASVREGFSCMARTGTGFEDFIMEKCADNARVEILFLV